MQQIKQSAQARGFQGSKAEESLCHDEHIISSLLLCWKFAIRQEARLNLIALTNLIYIFSKSSVPLAVSSC